MLLQFQLTVLEQQAHDARVAADNDFSNGDHGSGRWNELAAKDADRVARLLRRRRPPRLWRSDALSDHLAINAHFNG